MGPECVPPFFIITRDLKAVGWSKGLHDCPHLPQGWNSAQEGLQGATLLTPSGEEEEPPQLLAQTNIHVALVLKSYNTEVQVASDPLRQLRQHTFYWPVWWMPHRAFTHRCTHPCLPRCKSLCVCINTHFYSLTQRRLHLFFLAQILVCWLF